MKIEGEGQLLRVFVGESDRWHGEPLHQAIVKRAREEGLAGATVLRGLAGFGAHSRIHTSNILRLSVDLPVVIEIVDLAERIDRFLPMLDEMVAEGMVTLERAHIVAYRPGDASYPRQAIPADSAGPRQGPPNRARRPPPVGTTLAEAEKDLILRTLDETHGNKAEAARRLDVDVKTIRNKLRAWGIDQ
jgi:PII-like signaling protein